MIHCVMIKLLCLFVVAVSTVMGLSPNGTVPIKIAYSLPANYLTDYYTNLINITTAYIDIYLQNQSQLIDPNAKLELVLLDSGTTRAEAIRAVTEGYPVNHFLAVMGPGYSQTVIVTALAMSTYNIPVCDGGATSPELSDKSEFSNFFRTIPDDTVQGRVIADFCADREWLRVVIISANDAYGQGLTASFMNRLEDLAAQGIEIQVAASLTFFEPSVDAVGIISAIEKTAANIFLYFGLGISFRTVLVEANSKGFVGPMYQWIVSDGGLEFFDMSDNPSSQELDNGNGAIAVAALEANSPLVDTFLQSWRQRYGLPSDEPYPSYSLFYTSCVELLVHGFDRLLKTAQSQNQSITLDDLVQEQLNSRILIPDTFSFPTLDTLTGRVVLNSNGDRGGSFNFYSLWAREFNVIGTWTEGVIQYSDAPYLNDGTRGWVQDSSKVEPWYMSAETGTATAIRIIAAIGQLAVLALLALFYRNRTHVVIRRASPIFCYIVMIGLALGYTELYVMIGLPTNATCLADAWLSPLSFGIVFGGLIAKMTRIICAMYGIRLHRIGMRNLISPLIIGIVLFIEIVILGLWSVLSPPVPVVEQYGSLPSQLMWTCQSNYQSAFVGILLVYNSFLLLLGLILAFVTRHVKGEFNESSIIGACIYNIVMCTVLTLPILYLTDLAPYSKFIIKVTVIWYANTFVHIVMFGYHSWQLIHKGDLHANDPSVSASTNLKLGDPQRPVPRSVNVFMADQIGTQTIMHRAQIQHQTMTELPMGVSIVAPEEEPLHNRYPGFTRLASVMVRQRTGPLGYWQSLVIGHHAGLQAIVFLPEESLGFHKGPKDAKRGTIYFLQQFQKISTTRSGLLAPVVEGFLTDRQLSPSEGGTDALGRPIQVTSVTKDALESDLTNGGTADPFGVANQQVVTVRLDDLKWIISFKADQVDVANWVNIFEKRGGVTGGTVMQHTIRGTLALDALQESTTE